MDAIQEAVINIDLPVEILWIILAGILLFFIIMALVLQHHWNNYRVEGDPKNPGITLFWTVSLILILVMFLSIIFFENL